MNSIYNQHGKLIDNVSVSYENFVLLISPEDVTFDIVSGGKLINDTNDIVETFKGKVVTLFIDNNDTTTNNICYFNVINDTHVIEEYKIKFKDTNAIPDHYNTLIYNKNLPDNNTIQSCVVDKEKYMILGKLLLEYKTIAKYKGTITSIQKFFNFVGFEHVKLFPEYKNPNGSKTLIKNVDSKKTGYYHIIYDHDFINYDGWDRKNFPEIIRDDNVNDFIDNLYNIIQVARKHFMVPEQDISFFGINYTVKSPQFLSVAQNTLQYHIINPSHYVNHKNKFNLDVTIDNKLNKQFIVKDCISKDINVNNQEVKIKPLNPNDINKNIFYVYPETEDDDIVDNFDVYQAKFGSVINLEFLIPSKYLKYTIVNKSYPLIVLNSDKKFINGEYKNHFFINRPGKYEITVDIYDGGNNRERFIFPFVVSEVSNKINFELFTSGDIIGYGKNSVNDGIYTPNLQISFMDLPSEARNVDTMVAMIADNFGFDVEDVSFVKLIDNDVYLTVNKLNYYYQKHFNSNFVLTKIIETDGYLTLGDLEFPDSIEYLYLGLIDIKNGKSLKQLKSENCFFPRLSDVTLRNNEYIMVDVNTKTNIWRLSSNQPVIINQLFLDSELFKDYDFIDLKSVIAISGNGIDKCYNSTIDLSNCREIENYTKITFHDNVTNKKLIINESCKNKPAVKALMNDATVEVELIKNHIDTTTIEEYTFDDYTTEVETENNLDDTINTDVESPMDFKIKNKSQWPVKLDGEYNDLETYFDDITTASNLYRQSRNRYKENIFNPKYKLGDITNMPIRFINNWLHLQAFKIIDDTYDPIVDHSEYEHLKMLFIKKDIDGTAYVMVLNRNLGYVNETTILTCPKIELDTEKKIPVNYDFNVFDFDTTTEILHYQSLYPRLTDNRNNLKYNDIVYARPNLDDEINFNKVTWKIYDSITHQLIYETEEYSLKYHINKQIIADIEMKLVIDGVTNKSVRKKCFSSAKI